MVRWDIRRQGRIARGGGSRVTGWQALLRGWIYLKNVISTSRGRIASRGRGMLVAHWRRSAVVEALAHDLQGFSQQVEAAPRGGAEGVFMVRPVAYPPDDVIRTSFCKQPIAGTQQMLSHGWILGEFGVGTYENYISRSCSHTTASKLRTSRPHCL